MSQTVSKIEQATDSAIREDDANSTWQQRTKWVVYTLLLIDFAFYLAQDIQSAAYTMPAEPGLLDYGRAYVTSIDLAAWFVLIAFFELETWVISDQVWKGAIKWIVQGGRLLCYACILHTTFVDSGFLAEYYRPQTLPPASNLCDYTDKDWSFLRNRGYTYIDDNNCSELAEGTAHYAIGEEYVITDAAGLREAQILAWTDLIENLSWLLIIAISEIIVRNYNYILRSRVLLQYINYVKFALYSTIVGIAIYWGSKNQILYFYDELLWVLGFLAIESNLREWRLELLGQNGGPEPRS